MSTPDRRAMLERDHPRLLLRGQCRLLGLARSGVYRPAPANDDEDLALMQRIDALFMAWPFLGSRRLTAMMRAEGLTVNRKRVQRLMRTMGLEAIYPRPRTTQRNLEHRIYPYLLRDVAILPADQVWSTDITYIPLARGLRLPDCGPGLVQPIRVVVGAIPHARRRVLPGRAGASPGHLARRRSSTRTRARSSPAWPSRAGWSEREWRSAWTAAAGPWTTCSWSGCGGV